MPESHHINLNEQDSQYYKTDLRVLLRLYDNVLRHKHLSTTFMEHLSFKCEEIGQICDPRSFVTLTPWSLIADQTKNKI
jgi:hypothetical protein